MPAGLILTIAVSMPGRRSRGARCEPPSRRHVPIDWENVAEEIETLGRSERRVVASRIQMIVEHLLKLTVSPAAGPRQGWARTVCRAAGA